MTELTFRQRPHSLVFLPILAGIIAWPLTDFFYHTLAGGVPAWEAAYFSYDTYVGFGLPGIALGLLPYALLSAFLYAFVYRFSPSLSYRVFWGGLVGIWIFLLPSHVAAISGATHDAADGFINLNFALVNSVYGMGLGVAVALSMGRFKRWSLPEDSVLVQYSFAARLMLVAPLVLGLLVPSLCRYVAFLQASDMWDWDVLPGMILFQHTQLIDYLPFVALSLMLWMHMRHPTDRYKLSVLFWGGLSGVLVFLIPAKFLFWSHVYGLSRALQESSETAVPGPILFIFDDLLSPVWATIAMLVALEVGRLLHYLVVRRRA